jgi:hypothetical protein
VKAPVVFSRRIDSDPGSEMEPAMTRFFALIAAFAVYAPVAYAFVSQASQVIA